MICEPFVSIVLENFNEPIKSEMYHAKKILKILHITQNWTNTDKTDKAVLLLVRMRSGVRIPAILHGKVL